MTDLKYALRGFLRSPAFTFVAILSLALGIGANVTIYTIANAFLNQPVAGTTNPDGLVRIYRGDHSPLQYRELEYVRSHTDAFTGVLGERMLPVALSNGSGTERVTAALVTEDYFGTLGVPAAAGRLLVRGDSADPQSVVISSGLWQRRFAGTPAIAGEKIRVNDRVFTIAGVADERFVSSQFLWRADLWFLPGTWQAVSGSAPETYGGSLYVTARLRGGMDAAGASTILKTLALRMHAQDSTTYDERFSLRAASARGLTEELRGPAAAASAFLLVVVALVLLIACVNVANLLLARAAARRKEIGVRIAVGAKRRRLIRQLLTESALLTAVAAVIGVLAASWSADFIGRYVVSRSPEPISLALAPDGNVLAFTVIVSVLTTLLFGLLPAYRATSLDVLPVLRDEAAQTTGRSRTRSLLVGLQVTWCTVLLACATLFLRSLQNARVIDPGFDPTGVVDVSVDLRSAHLSDDQGRAFYQRLNERARELPGVRSATVAALTPLGGSNMQVRLWAQGQSRDERPQMPYFNVVGANYFETLGIPVVAGRSITADDRATTPPVTVVNERMARLFWPGENPIGKRVSMDSSSWMTVVGVVRDTKYNSLGESTPAFMYLPFEQNYRSEMVLQVRDGANSLALRQALPQLVHDLDPQLPPVAAATLAEDMRISLLPAQLAASLLGAFGMLALLLATIGIYGVTSYTVAQRTRELGIRTALGASGTDILRLLLGQSLRVVAIGAGVGLALALGIAKLISSQLYGVSPRDPATFIGMPLLLIGVAMLATLIPARRATRADPVVTLRAE